MAATAASGSSMMADGGSGARVVAVVVRWHPTAVVAMGCKAADGGGSVGVSVADSGGGEGGETADCGGGDGM